MCNGMKAVTISRPSIQLELVDRPTTAPRPKGGRTTSEETKQLWRQLSEALEVDGAIRVSIPGMRSADTVTFVRGRMGKMARKAGLRLRVQLQGRSVVAWLERPTPPLA